MSIDEEQVCDHCAGERQGPCSIDNTLRALSINLRNSLQGTSRWNISDITAGLFKVYNLHALYGATDTINNGIMVNNRNELEEMLEWMRWSKAAYYDDNISPVIILELNDKDLVKMVTKSGIHKPAFFIGIHHTRKCVVMAVRGTHQKQDVFTDLNSNTEQFQQGFAHSGMLEAARWLFENEGKTLQSLLAQYMGYRLILTGHSLGAAIASLLAMMIHATNGWFMPKEKSRVPSSKILCWGYGCAPCVDRKLAETSNFICNIILQDDIVARMSPAGVEALRTEILGISWSQVVTDERTKMVLEKMGQVHNNFGSILSTGGTILASGAQAVRATLSQKIASVSEKVGILTMKKDNIDATDPKIAVESASNIVLKSTSQQDVEQPVNIVVATAQSQTSITTTNLSNDDEEPNSKSATQTLMAVAAAAGSSVDMEELERRRLFVPGVLYHIKRQQQQQCGERTLSLPTSKELLAGVSESSSTPMYNIVRGQDPKERFSRIIVSKTIISDHICLNYLDAISKALGSCS